MKSIQDLDIKKIAFGVSNPMYKDNLKAVEEMVSVFNDIEKHRVNMIQRTLECEEDYIKTYDESFYTYQDFDSLVESEKEQPEGMTRQECIKMIGLTIFPLNCGWYLQYV